MLLLVSWSTVWHINSLFLKLPKLILLSFITWCLPFSYHQYSSMYMAVSLLTTIIDSVQHSVHEMSLFSYRPCRPWVQYGQIIFTQMSAQQMTSLLYDGIVFLGTSIETANSFLSRIWNSQGWKRQLCKQNSYEILIQILVKIIVLYQILMSCSTGTAGQNKFIPTYVVELSKPYRLVLESWESVQALYFIPLYRETYLSAACRTHAAKWLPRSSWTSPSYETWTSR